MDHQYSKEDLAALCIPEEERSYQGQADRLSDNISRAVLIAAKLGKTSIKDFAMMTPDILTAMVIRQVKKRFYNSLVGYEMKEGSEIKLVYVDWS
jgi:hypothetical protein